MTLHYHLSIISLRREQTRCMP